MSTAATPAVPVRVVSPAPPSAGVGVTCPGWAHRGVSRGVPCASSAGTEEQEESLMAGSEGSEAPPHRAAARHSGWQCGRAAVRACGKPGERHGELGTGGSGCVFPPGAARSRRTGGGGSTGGLHGDGGAASVSPADSRRGGRHRSPAWHRHRHPRPAHRLPWHHSLPAAPAPVLFWEGIKSHGVSMHVSDRSAPAPVPMLGPPQSPPMPLLPAPGVGGDVVTPSC